MSRLRRPILHSRFFFVTTNLRQGLRRFDEVEFRLPADSLILVRERLPVAVCAYCFMPDHVHAILFPQENTTISDVMMRFKVAASRRIVPRRGQAIWQARFFDRVLRNRAEYDETFEYVHMNPVQRGLVENAREWEWSSACWFAKGEGPLAMDEIRLPTSPAGWI